MGLRTGFATLLLVVLTGAAAAQVPAGERLLGLEITEAENESFDAAFQRARAAGATVTHRSLAWEDLEPDAGQFDAYSVALLDDLDIYFSLTGQRVELNFGPIDTPNLRVPADLAGVPLNARVMIGRFNAALDTVFAHLSHVELLSLEIGNECDVYLGTDPVLYAQYRDFFTATKAHAESLYAAGHGGADLDVGITWTWDALVDSVQGPLIEPLVQRQDVLPVTYYPLRPDFTVRPPEDVFGDLVRLVTAFPDTARPILLVECGYPSSPVCGSSFQAQADFVDNVFLTWDALADRIRYVSFFMLTDWSRAYVDLLADYYGLADPAFLEFLRTLGLRLYPGDGFDKLGWRVLQCDAALRGFSAAPCDLVTGADGVAPPAGEVACRPNPANPSVTISCVSPRTGRVTATVYDVTGRRVRRLGEDIRPAGPVSWRWDGRDAAGGSAPAGVYLVRIVTPDGVRRTGRVVLVR